MEEFKITELNDLAKIDVDEQIDIKAGKNFIRRWYDGSIVQALQRLYPLAKLDEELFKKHAEERAKIPKVKGAYFLSWKIEFHRSSKKETNSNSASECIFYSSSTPICTTSRERIS